MKIDKSLITGSTSLLILSLLQKEDMYGYLMITELEKKSDDTFTLKEGTLYPLLHKLENQGYITSYSNYAPNGRNRKYYSLTRKGIKQLEVKKKEWNLFSNKVNKVINRDNYGTS